MINCLNYPYDSSLIMRKAKSLRRELLEVGSKKKIKIAILGGTSTSHVKTYLDLFLLKRGIEASFWESEYNQFYTDAVMGNDSLREFSPEIVLVYLSHRNIGNFPQLGEEENSVSELRNKEIFNLQQIWDGIKKQTSAVIIQNNFEFPDVRHLGNLEGVIPSGKIHYIRSLNQEVASQSLKLPGVYIHDQNYLSSMVGLEKWHDQDWWNLYKYHSSVDSLPFIGESLAGMIQAILGLSKKNLILDLDNTLWGGVIGDDGPDGIHIGPDTAQGEAYKAFQEYCKGMKERGIVLSVCSKNDQKNAEEGFLKQDSVLKLQDFASFKANWDRKDQNIALISDELSLGLDSFVFIDDNPTEREIVKQGLPSLSVPNVGSEVGMFARHIDRNYYFETVSLSADDQKRSLMYEQNAQRRTLERNFSDYGEYLDSLEMVGEIATFKKEFLERITQLINKTNQFNLTTKRMTIEEVSRRSEDDLSVNIYGRLKDKFGDNGLVSLVMGNIQGKQLHIDVWLMSCRVLKKDFEKAMLDELVKESVAKGVQELIGDYIPSAKNKMVENLYQELGFTLVSENKWSLNLLSYEYKNKHIRIQND